MKTHLLLFAIITIFSSCSKNNNYSPPIKSFEETGAELKLSNILFNTSDPLFGSLTFKNPTKNLDWTIKSSTGVVSREATQTIIGAFNFTVENLEPGDQNIQIEVMTDDGSKFTKKYEIKVIEGFSVDDVWNSVTKEMSEKDYLGTGSCFTYFDYGNKFQQSLIRGGLGIYSFEFNNNGVLESIYIDGSNVTRPDLHGYPISNRDYNSLLRSIDAGPSRGSEALGKYVRHYRGRYIIEGYQYEDENRQLVMMGDNHAKISIDKINYPQ